MQEETSSLESAFASLISSLPAEALSSLPTQAAIGNMQQEIRKLTSPGRMTDRAPLPFDCTARMLDAAIDAAIGQSSSQPPTAHVHHPRSRTDLPSFHVSLLQASAWPSPSSPANVKQQPTPGTHARAFVPPRIRDPARWRESMETSRMT